MGGAGLVILADPWSARTHAANVKLNVALIGVGGRGKWYVDVMPSALLTCERRKGWEL